jgi:PAS domain S-box-containing protein
MNHLHSDIHTILLVEDSPADAQMVKERLKDAPGRSLFDLIHVHSLQEALECLQNIEIQVILLDLNLPESSGLDTLTLMRKKTLSIPIVVLTGTEDEPLALEAIKLGAQDYLPKSQMNPALLSRILFYAIERAKSERSRLESQRTFRLFVEGATGLAFIMLDTTGKIIHWNSGAQRLFGYDEDSALNRYFSFLFTEEDQRKGRPESELRQAMADEKGNDDNWLVRADGTRFWASGAVTAVRDSDNNLIGFAKMVRDNTAQKEANDQLAKLNRTLEERVNQRTQELVRYQKRLRSLASDLTLTEQRERRRLALDLHDYLAQLLIACRLKFSQSRLLTDIQRLQTIIQESDSLLEQALEYTRTLVSQLSPSCLYEFGLSAALEWLGSEMHHQGLEVSIQGDPLALDLKEDQAILLYQSVRELLFNVLKHSGVTKATVSWSIPAKNFLQIEVRDKGCGFRRNGEEKEKHSSKFGLFSIQERLEAIGGETVITSAPQMGTQVCLRIPLVLPKSEPPDAADAKNSPLPYGTPVRTAHVHEGKIRILLVDDHKMVREGFCHILNAQPDMEVVGESEDGRHAIGLCHSLRPDVVVMDLNMCGMDGLEATRRIKEAFPQIFVIGLSVHDTPETARWFQEVGATNFVAKGGSAENLMHAIRAAIPWKGPSRKRRKRPI